MFCLDPSEGMLVSLVARRIRRNCSGTGMIVGIAAVFNSWLLKIFQSINQQIKLKKDFEFEKVTCEIQFLTLALLRWGRRGIAMTYSCPNLFYDFLILLSVTIQ